MKPTRRQFVTGSFLAAISSLPLVAAAKSSKRKVEIPGDLIWSCDHLKNLEWKRADQVSVYTHPNQDLENMSSANELLGAKATVHLSNGQTLTGEVDHVGWFIPEPNHPVRTLPGFQGKALSIYLKLPQSTSARGSCYYQHTSAVNGQHKVIKNSPYVERITFEAQ